MVPSDKNIEEYKVVVSPNAKRNLKKLAKKIEPDQFKRIDKKISGLGKDPRPKGHEKLSGEDKYRIRDGDYRILYYIDDRNKIIEIGAIGNRKDIYDH